MRETDFVVASVVFAAALDAQRGTSCEPKSTTLFQQTIFYRHVANAGSLVSREKQLEAFTHQSGKNFLNRDTTMARKLTEKACGSTPKREGKAKYA